MATRKRSAEKEPKPTASAILGLLRAKHSDDIFVDECKDGPSQYQRGHLRLDAWVMPRSWAKPSTTGYEIKVSRSDFLSDEKWRGYLDLCNRFYFVAPPGVIQPDELPTEAGLIVTSKNGVRLFTKKKAPERDVEIPESLFRYVLMCRSKITLEHGYADLGASYWQNWLATKKENRELGYNVSRALRELVSERVDVVHTENVRLKSELANVQKFRDALEGAGLTVREWNMRSEVEGRLKRTAMDCLPKDMAWRIQSLHDELGRAMETISDLDTSATE